MRRDRGFYRFLGVCALYFLASNLAHPVTPTLIVERGLDSSLFGVALAAMERISAGEPGDAAALTPNYLRQAQAERTRQHDKDFYLKK